MARVAFSGVGKVFGGSVRALSGLDLDVPDGEFLVLVGPSGCGKSTALRILAGLEHPSEGRVFIGDRDVTDADPSDRDVAMVFQNYALYPHMSVSDNMGFALRMRRTPRDEIRKRVGEAAGILGIGDLLSRKPRELSGGQRQRVALGRAIVRHPSAFLFDEPLSNLDARLRVQMRSELSLLHKRLGATMLYVTHDQVEAMTLGHRIVVLRAGTVQQIASPMELYSRPANEFVAGFIGSPSMNIYDSSVAGGTARLADGSILAEGLHVPDGRCRIGARPEHVTIPGSLHGVIQVVETLGNEKIVYIDFQGSTTIVRVDPTVEAESGSSVGFGLDPAGIHVFGEDGARMDTDA